MPPPEIGYKSYISPPTFFIKDSYSAYECVMKPSCWYPSNKVLVVEPAGGE